MVILFCLFGINFFVMKKVAIVYHSGYGHTELVAQYIKKGFTKCDAKLYKVADFFENEALLDELKDASMIVFGSPTYMGSVSADFKKFMDLSSKVWFAQGWKDKLAAGFTNSHSLNGDKANTMATLFTFACQHSMIWVSQGVGSDGGLNRLGSTVGLFTQAQNTAPAESFEKADLDTAEAFGKRLCEINSKLGNK